MKNSLRRSIASPLATLALTLVPCLGWSAPPEATAYQVTVDHAGVTTSGGVLALQETPLWTATLLGPSSSPSASSYPIIADGRVFVTTAGIGSISFALLYAFDAQTGATLWGPLDVGGFHFSGLTYDAGTLFVVNNNGLLTSRNPATGTVGWSVQIPDLYTSGFSSPPTASNGILYVAGPSGALYAVNESNGQLLWTAGATGGGWGSPAVGPSGVYLSYPCHAYDFALTSTTATGQLIWNYAGSCSGGGGNTPVYANGYVYIRDPAAAPGVPAKIYDANTGALGGTFSATVAPAISSTNGFFLNGGTLSATDLATGTVLWSFAGDGHLVTAPVLVDDTVIIGSYSGMLYGLNTQTGNVTWQVATGTTIPDPGEQSGGFTPVSGLAIADGLLVVPAASSLLAYKIFGPPGPTGLAATGAAGAVDLSWSAAAGATSYNIYMGSSAAAENVVPVQTGVTGTSTQLTNLTPGTTYFFTVKALGSKGISAPSNEASAVPNSPAPPTALSATVATGSVTLSWTASSGAISYNVYMGTSAGGESTTAVASVTTPGATVTGLTLGMSYYFFVKAVSYGSVSSPSNEVSAAPLAPPPPTNLSATAGPGQVGLTWSASAGATSYQVFMGTSAGGESSTPVQSGITGLSMTVNGLTNGTAYYYVVRAVTPGGLSSPSNEASATPAAAPSPTPTKSGGGGAFDVISLLLLTAIALMSSRRREARVR